jgi:hypothetical protein
MTTKTLEHYKANAQQDNGGAIVHALATAALERSNHARDMLGRESIMAINPSVRTFATGYAPTAPDTGMAFEC